jgi:uncharacterized membrane protein YfcA
MDISFFPSYFHWWHIPVVLLAGMIGEGYAVIIGGGGVLIQFVLFSLGMPLPMVIATDIAGCMGSGLGVISAYSRDIWSNKHLLWYLSIPFFIGGVIGTLFLTKISPVVLSYLLIVALGALLLLMVLQKNQQTQNLSELSINKKQYPLLASVMAGLGVYSNVSGVGSGTFIKIVYTGLLKMKPTDSIGVTNIVYLPPTIFSLVVTAVVGLLAWPYVITLWIGTFIGAHYVAKYAQKIPENYLRKILMFICLIYLLYLVWKIL